MGSPSGGWDIEGVSTHWYGKGLREGEYSSNYQVGRQLRLTPHILGAEDLGAEDREMAINIFITDSAFFAQK